MKNIFNFCISTAIPPIATISCKNGRIMNRTGKIALILMAAISINAFAQNNFEVVWKHNFGGRYGEQYNFGTAVPDGVVAVGRAMIDWNGNVGDWEGVVGKGGYDASIVKYNHSGKVVWKKNFGGSGGDEYLGVTEVPDGVVAVGYSQGSSFGNGDWEGVAGKGWEDAIIVKYNHNGEVVWKKNFGGSGFNYYYSVTAVSDGVVAVGYSVSNSFGTGDWEGVTGKANRDYYDAIIVKYDLSGNMVWKNNFGGSFSNYFYDLTAVSDGVVAVGNGYTGGGDWEGVSGTGNAIIVKYDNNGKVVWKKHFGSSSAYNYFQSVTAVADGVVVAGYSGALANSYYPFVSDGDWEGIAGKGMADAVIVKYDHAGDVVWKKNFGGSLSDVYYSVTAVSDGVVTVGHSAYGSFGNGDWEGIQGKGKTVNDNDADAIIVKYDHNGNVAWKKNFGGNGWDVFLGVTAVSDDAVAVGYSGFASFGNGDWTGVTGRGGEDAIIVKYGTLIPVTNITGVPTTATAGTPLTLAGTVAPANASNQTIEWTVQSAGSTGASIAAGTNILATTAAGAATVRASIICGAAGSGIYTQDFNITVGASAGFVAVTGITGVPATATAGTPLTLTGTVAPANATNKTIVWTVQSAGSTGASIAAGSNTLNTTAAGAATVRATIANGATATTNYTQDFAITVSSASTPATITVLSSNLTLGQAISLNDNQVLTTPAGTTATFSGTATLLAIPAAGVFFTGWNDGNTDNPRKVNVIAAITYTAQFAEPEKCEECEVCKECEQCEECEVCDCSNCPGGGTQTSVSETQSSRMQVYPNPVAGVLYVQFESAVNGGILTLYDMNGKTVLTQSAGGTAAQIDLSPLPAGSYILRLTENGVMSAGIKVIKN